MARQGARSEAAKVKRLSKKARYMLCLGTVPNEGVKPCLR